MPSRNVLLFLYRVLLLVLSRRENHCFISFICKCRHFFLNRMEFDTFCRMGGIDRCHIDAGMLGARSLSVPQEVSFFKMVNLRKQ